MKSAIRSIDDIPISLCRSTFIMRTSKTNYPPTYSYRRCINTEPCIRVLLPQTPKANVWQKPRKNMSLYFMFFICGGILVWLTLHVIFLAQIPF
jgi:hypothetical protein